ncbi:MAG: adenylate/guanylate cyclase domain-containing protein [Alphaproteobacteria bacterium]
MSVFQPEDPAAGYKGGRALLRAAERDGVRLWCRAKLLAYGVIALWLAAENPFPEAFWFLGTIAVFSAMALSLIAISRRAWFRDWIAYGYAGIEAIMCVVVLMTPNPFAAMEIPMTDMLRFTPMVYLFVFLASTALTLAPWLVIWAGVIAAAAWIGTALLVLAVNDDAFAQVFVDPAIENWADLSFVYQPNFVNLGRHIEETLVILVVTGVLAGSAWRARRLMIERLRSERARLNLARYFAPALVEELARDSHNLSEIAEHDAAVLFVDIVGFTKRCEGMGAAATMRFLRAFHRRMDAAVFRHDGTLDKYIGDAVMATFGTPRAGPRDAANALTCAVAIQEAVHEWNRQLIDAGAPPVSVGVGVHYGPVVMGDIGGEQRLEFAVIGDTVNVASRLESLTRQRHAEIVVSEELMAAARAQGVDPALTEGFVPGDRISLRGRTEPIAIWQRPRREALAGAAAE